ncbi:unnamed protein product [Lactuca saligna]|uniref:Uncharacterized protein n=1 Tax=Lactuca saligna TaxID=75948 RepID=A0AA35YIE5_LACSI|nr:unnamed protein product [Lactuca saligna]
MCSEANQMAQCGSAAASPTVKELISLLRSSFLASEFQDVEKILVEREDHMRDQCNELRKKAETFEKEKDVLSIKNQKLNDEMKKKQREVDALRKENLEYKDQIKVLNSEKCRVSKSALEDELKMKQSEIDGLRKLNVDYEKKEADLRFYKKQSTDLHDRVLKLEKTAKELIASAGSSSINQENSQQKNSTAENIEPPLLVAKGDNKIKTEPKLQEIIQIDDDDDLKCHSTLKRKQSSNEVDKKYSSDFVDDIQPATQKRKNLQDLYNQPIISNPHSTPQSSGITPRVEKVEPRNLLSSLDSPASISDLNTNIIDGAYKSIIARNKMIKGKWRFKSEMLEEFDKDDELCMNAICALHRQSRTVLPLFDKSRITQLALLLINGDPQQKLKKTASEVNPCDVDECRMLAKKYAAQIFNIFKNKDDPFFPPSTS